MSKLYCSVGVIIAVLIASLLGTIVFGTSARGEVALSYRQYSVKPGDTLWDIAKEYSSGKTDIRKYIHKIKRENGMDGADLMPGQVLNIPMEY